MEDWGLMWYLVSSESDSIVLVLFFSLLGFWVK